LILGASRIATGHYARLDHNNGSVQLRKGIDGNKDQSYFLFMLNQQQLGKTIFPIGEMTKEDVRNLAKEKGLPNHDRKDSTGVCFIGERNFTEFLHQYFKSDPGNMVTIDGKTSPMVEYQSLFWDEVETKAPEKQLPDLEVDTKF